MEGLLWLLIGWLICAWCLWTGYQGYQQWERSGRTISKQWMWPTGIGILLFISQILKLF